MYPTESAPDKYGEGPKQSVGSNSGSAMSGSPHYSAQVNRSSQEPWMGANKSLQPPPPPHRALNFSHFSSVPEGGLIDRQDSQNLSHQLSPSGRFSNHEIRSSSGGLQFYSPAPTRSSHSPNPSNLMPPGYSEATSGYWSPTSNANYGPNFIQRRNSSVNNSSFATCPSETVVTNGTQEPSELRLANMNTLLQEEVQKLRKEKQQHLEEVSYYRSMWASAASKKRIILDSYNRDVILLLNVIDKLSASPSESVVKNESLAKSAKDLQLKRILNAVDDFGLKGGGKDAPSSSGSKHSASLRAISSALRLNFECWGMSLGKRSAAISKGEDDRFLADEGLREVAVETQRSVQAYLSSLNYGFTSAPLVIQMPATLPYHTVASTNQ